MTKNVDGDSFSPSTEEYLNSSLSPSNSLEQAILKSSMPYMTQTNHMTNGHVEMTDINGYGEKEVKKGKGKRSAKRSGSNETPMIDNLLTEKMNHSQNSLNLSNADSLDDSYTHNSIDFESGPFKEMAIDVPSNFHGSAKTPPRYPSNHSSPRSTPFKTDSAKKAKTGNNTQYSDEQLERIRKQQKDIRDRNDREEQRIKEQEFLRVSLRRSDKMRALEKKKKVAGIENTAYEAEPNDDDSGGFEEGYVSGRHTQKDYMKKNLSHDDILASLQHIKGRVTSPEGREKVKFLQSLFTQQQFQNAVKVHHKVLDVRSRGVPVKATCLNAQEMTEDSSETLCSLQSPQALELAELLNKAHFKSLLATHDTVGMRELRSAEDQPPDDFDIPNIPDGSEPTVKVVHLQKTTEPLGATVRNDGESVIISRIVKGGTADKSGLLHEGDEILDINGVAMKGKDINDVSEMLADMSGTISFTIYPNESNSGPAHSTGIMHVKALFNYDPEEDLYIPCRELGLSFMKGDILHVINQDDSNWWQAYREGEEDYQTLAGLIPSKSFHEQRESMRVTLGAENKENQKKGRSCSCGRSNKKKKKKNMYRHQEETDEILSYEEVAQYYPEPMRRRLIILIGPKDVGPHVLRARLMESDLDRFAAAIPHTSRPVKVPGPGEEPEIDGRDYHFVSREVFTQDIETGRFIEYGDFEKNLYGTSVDAVRQVINNGKICILNTYPEALYVLHNTDLKPYVIFIYPPNIEKLRTIQEKMGFRDIKDDMLRSIIEQAREMEDKFGHMFDHVIVNTDMDKTFDELKIEIDRIEVEPQWVPIAWTR